MHLLNLPSETISLIFEFLGEYDLTSLILAQSVCRSLHEVVRRILFHQLGSVHRGGDINPLLIQRFNSLFDTGELSRRGVPATDSDRNQPFYRLPWAACRCAVYGGTSMQYAQLEITPESGLTMGMFYDLLASGQGTLHRATREWLLQPGRRLGSYDNWLLLRDEHRYPSRDSIMDIFVEDEASRHSAVLFIKGHNGCKGSSYMKRKMDSNEEEDEDSKPWKPCAIGGIPIVLRSWQGVGILITSPAGERTSNHFAGQQEPGPFSNGLPEPVPFITDGPEVTAPCDTALVAVLSGKEYRHVPSTYNHETNMK
ncbi:hypothetical protein F4819DRAFT_487836 [Hypoxylon fuscum]|nr:hypothetical protein F4819DRAFT_487836 [Hypoxylon fuscum]